MKHLLLIFFLYIVLPAHASTEKFYQQVMIGNAKSAVNAAQELTSAIENSNQIPKKEFQELIFSWKQVEATYILSSLDEEYFELPWYLDMFHGNNEDIKAQLDRILSGDSNIENALYKNSHKTINALEYVLFSHDLNSPRIKSAALIISGSIENRLIEILNGYKTYQEKFVSNRKIASSHLLNALVESSYKLKEWRIGDVAGLTRKFKEKANNKRAEYHISGNSTLAIRAILLAHMQTINSNEYDDFGDFARDFEADKEIDTTIDWLNNSIEIVGKIENDDLTGGVARELYVSISHIQDAYYLSLMNKLQFVSKILDADGD
tara:strand:- start:2125 stop:3087 length:963 start_codon:yes stop_codon:yes gene_type:complete